MDPFEKERGLLATYRIEGNQLLKTTDGTNWRPIFTYGNVDRMHEIARLLNDAAIGNCTWLRKELGGEMTYVISCDSCPLFDNHNGPQCGHPKHPGRAVVYVESKRPEWCPLDAQPLYLKTLQA